MTVIVIGSSGGGAATLGHDNPVELLTTIHKQLGKIQPHIQHANKGRRTTKRRNKTLTQTNSDSDSDAQRFYPHGITLALFVSLHGGKGFDSASPENDMATLWTVGIDDDDNDDNNGQVFRLKNDKQQQQRDNDFQVKASYTGSLQDVNNKVKDIEETIIAPLMMMIDKNETDENGKHISQCCIKGMIVISCDPMNANKSSIAAAAKSGIPITGTGGTSLGAAATLHQGLNLVGNAGGSVATTTFTRALSYCYALAHAWGETYNPFDTKGKDDDVVVVKPHIRSILDACLPSFLGVCLTCHILSFVQTIIPMIVTNNGNNLHWNSVESIDKLLFQLRFQALPTVCAVVTASTYSPEHGSTAIMAACVASMGCSGSILAGLLAGWIVSVMVGRVLYTCIRWRVPATMSNIIVGGCVGAFIGLSLTFFGITSFLSIFTEIIRTVVRSRPTIDSISWNGSGYGFLVGCIFFHGSKVGWYHKFFLPIILIEMEQGEASLWGAVDECTLVVVSAGICAANMLCSSSKHECKRGFIINTLCGDFIEVAYPFMEKSWIVNIAAYIASGASTEILYGSNTTHTSSSAVLGSAYVPFFICISLAKKDWYRMMLAVLVSFITSFFGMAVSAAKSQSNSSIAIRQKKSL